MIRTVRFAVGIFATAAGIAAQATPAEKGRITTAEGLVAAMRAEQEAKKASQGSARMEMVTRGKYPDGVAFEIRGTIRVLGETHFHSLNLTKFEDHVTAESETAKTPDGVWMREKNPAFGEVFTKMSPDLVKKVERARAILGQGEGHMQNPAKDLRGAAMLESLGRQFSLEVSRKTIDRQEYYVVQGDAKGGAPKPETSSFPTPDRVELLVRLSDYAVVRMTQFERGQELMQVEILRLDYPPMDEESFKIELPDGAEFIDVTEHPPAAAQIRRLLDDAEAKTEADGPESRPSKKPPGK